MLSQADTERIKAEEQLRFEIRSQLEKTKAQQGHPIVGFLNTNLGIFLLSSIFLSSFSWVYNEYKTGKDRQLKNQQEKTFLHYELSQRVAILRQLEDTVSEDTKKDIIGAVHGGFDYSIRKDYRGLSLSALLVNYETLSDTTISPQVQAAIQVLNQFEQYEDQLQGVQRLTRQHGVGTYYYLPTPVKAVFRKRFLNKLTVFT